MTHERLCPTARRSSGVARAARAIRKGILGVGAGLIAMTLAPSLHAGDPETAELAKIHALTMELSTEEARRALGAVAIDNEEALIASARLDLYEGRCDEAWATLDRLPSSDRTESLAGPARGCRSAMAGAIVREDEASGTWIRFQDDRDEALAPSMFETVKRAREVFKSQLGVEMPRPIRIEWVRDQFSLSAMTGLSLDAARTTGTIGIAKWGRVVLVSPRGTENGYNYLDTLAHELTHLALTRGSSDRAPLWLQEGVARIEESQWRPASPFDDRPSSHDLAAYATRKKLGPEIDKIGPSIALLPSAVEAQLTYAKVQSFMRFYESETGPGALGALLTEFRGSENPDDFEGVVERASQVKFSAWAARWKTFLSGRGELGEADRPGAPPIKGLRDARKAFRLGELLADRDHDRASVHLFQRTHAALPADAATRAALARVLRRLGDIEAAGQLVAEPSDVGGGHGLWWSLRALLDIDGARSLAFALAVAPYDPAVACRELKEPALPDDPIVAALCKAAREKPRAR